jgi:hypothetical protein
MAGKKLDGIIEAVRYTPDGKVLHARGYRRTGAVWSDLELIDRQVLVEALQKKKTYVVGQRRQYLGGVFTTGAAVLLSDGRLMVDGRSGRQDNLAGVPVF